MRFVLIVGLVCLMAGVTAAWEQKHIYCGEKLYDALELVCRGKFYGAMKRNLPAIGNGLNENYDYEQVGEDFSWPYPSGKAVSTVFRDNPKGSTHPRYRRGVVDECCRKPCGKSDLERYCA